MGSGLRAGAWLVVLAGLLGACAAETDDEVVGEDTQEVTSGRCAGTRGSKTVTVKVMTMNLRHDSDQWERRFPLIADEIDRLDPDIIGLQEVEIADDQADRLNELLAKRGHAKYHVYAKRKSGVTGYFSGEGVAILSRWPITEKHHEDTGEMRVSIHARTKHPSGGSIDIIDTHLDHRGGAEGDATRDDQARQTLDLTKRNDDCHPTVLTGDMNATEGSPAMIVLKDGAFTQSPKRRIDFVLGRSAGGRTVKALDSVVCFKNHDSKGFYPSDHLGVMTTYEMRL